MSASEMKQVMKEQYGQAAFHVKAGSNATCGTSGVNSLCCHPITSNLYDSAQSAEIPEDSVLVSVGCANPTALAQLDLGDVGP